MTHHPKHHKEHGIHHPHHRDGKESTSHYEDDSLCMKKNTTKHQVVKDSMHGMSKMSHHVKTNVKGSKD